MDEGVLIRARENPRTWLENKVYFIKNGDDADLYVTDNYGNPSRVGNFSLTSEAILKLVNDSPDIFLPESTVSRITDLENSWERIATNIKYRNTTVLSSGTVLTGDFFGNTIYRYYTNTNDVNGYPLEDSFYSGFDGTNLTGLIKTRNI